MREINITDENGNVLQDEVDGIMKDSKFTLSEESYKVIISIAKETFPDITDEKEALRKLTQKILKEKIEQVKKTNNAK